MVMRGKRECYVGQYCKQDEKSLILGMTYPIIRHLYFMDLFLYASASRLIFLPLLQLHLYATALQLQWLIKIDLMRRLFDYFLKSSLWGREDNLALP